MADELSKKPGPFDVRTIKALVALMTQNDLAEIDLRDGEQRLRLRRGLAPVMSEAFAPRPAPAAVPAPTANAVPRDEGPTPVAAPSRKLLEIKSQTIGTFYSAANPGAPPFVKVGDRVTPTTVVGLVEAMKIFNEITADCTGVIEEVLAENGAGVEFGQVLFRVNPA